MKKNFMSRYREQSKSLHEAHLKDSLADLQARLKSLSRKVARKSITAGSDQLAPSQLTDGVAASNFAMQNVAECVRSAQQGSDSILVSALPFIQGRAVRKAADAIGCLVTPSIASGNKITFTEDFIAKVGDPDYVNQLLVSVGLEDHETGYEALTLAAEIAASTVNKHLKGLDG